MTASLDLIWQQARQGQAEAIAHLMNRTLQAKGVRALVRRRGDCLQIMFEAARSLPPQVCVQFVCRGLKQLAPQGVLRVRLHARLLGEEWPEWTQTIDLQETLPAAPSVQTSSNPTTPATTPSHQAVSAFALSLLAIAGTGAVALTLQNQLSVDAPPSAEPSPAITTPEPDVPLVPPTRPERSPFAD